MSSNAGKWAYAAVFIVLGAVFVAVIAFLLYGFGVTPTPFHAQAAPGRAQPRHVYLTLQTFPSTPTDAWMREHHYHFASATIPPLNAHSEWVRYGPNTNLVLPAHALVTMTIENYDGQTPILNNFYSQVQGTVGNTMTVNGKTVKTLDPSTVSHTFTIHSIPSANQPWLYVSVPILGEPDAVESAGADNGFPPHPEVMQFSFMTSGPGQYIWQCFDPCGWAFNGFGGPMQTKGFMSGTVTVQ